MWFSTRRAITLRGSWRECVAQRIDSNQLRSIDVDLPAGEDGSDHSLQKKGRVNRHR